MIIFECTHGAVPCLNPTFQSQHCQLRGPRARNDYSRDSVVKLTAWRGILPASSDIVLQICNVIGYPKINCPIKDFLSRCSRRNSVCDGETLHFPNSFQAQQFISLIQTHRVALEKFGHSLIWGKFGHPNTLWTAFNSTQLNSPNCNISFIMDQSTDKTCPTLGA